MSKKGGIIGCVFLGVVIVFGLVMALICTTRVPAGYVAVQYSINGGVKGETLKQGWHIVSPTIKTENYSVGIEQSYLTKGKKGDSKDDEHFEASSSEGKSMSIELTFTYQYKADEVQKVFSQFKGQDGKEVRDVFIKPNIVSWTKEVVAKYAVADILGSKRSEVNSALTDYLAKKFEPYSIVVSNVSLIDVNVDKDTQRAINRKIKAQQNAETQAINNKTAIDKAKAQAEAKVTKAKADAEAKLISAKAEKKANELLTKSLSNQILNEKWISKWNGKLPQYLTDGNSSVIVDLNNK